MLKRYLEQIQKDESMFPMDSVHTGKKAKRKFIYDESMVNNHHQRIMIDFDGVIHEYTEWNNGQLNGPIEGAKEAIDNLKEKYQIGIFTTRASFNENNPEITKQLIENVADFLNTNDIHFDFITADKLGAFAYIDDKGIRFEGDWNTTLQKIEELESM